jgi:hypothetical protein
MVSFLLPILEDKQLLVRSIACWTLSRYSRWLVQVRISDPGVKDVQLLVGCTVLVSTSLTGPGCFVGRFCGASRKMAHVCNPPLLWPLFRPEFLATKAPHGRLCFHPTMPKLSGLLVCCLAADKVSFLASAPEESGIQLAEGKEIFPGLRAFEYRKYEIKNGNASRRHQYEVVYFCSA